MAATPIGSGPDDAARFTRFAALLGWLAGIEPVTVLGAGDTAPPSASAVVGHLTLLVPMQGLIDPAVELARLQKKHEKNQQEIKRALAKLENPNFISNAPAEVVATLNREVNRALARELDAWRLLLARAWRHLEAGLSVDARRDVDRRGHLAHRERRVALAAAGTADVGVDTVGGARGNERSQ